MAYYLKDLPFTEEGKKLKLSDEDRERFRLVYKREGDGWILHDIYEKGGEYGDDCIVVPLESTLAGNAYFEKGQEFANVKGSAHDPKPQGYNSWIDLWGQLSGTTPPYHCCTDGMMYSSDGKMKCMNSLNKKMIGGHVIKGKNSTIVVEGEIVYIVPICEPHNLMASGYYMKTANKTFAAMLNYKVNPYAYLAQHPLETHEKI